MKIRFHPLGPTSTIALTGLMLGFAALLLAATPKTSSSSSATAFEEAFPKPGYNSKGELQRPEGYREWVYVGTPLTPNDLNPPEAAFPEFHNVYIHPGDFAHYKATGDFPDGTIIIKELVLVGAQQAVSGKGYFMGEFTGLEATVKDSKRFKDEPGHWAYFSFGHSYPLADTAAAFPTAACNACHDASAAQDFVFTQYYPVLRAARGSESEGAKSQPGAARKQNAMNTQAEEFQSISSSMAGKVEMALTAGAPTGNVHSAVPTNPEELFAFLQAGKYKSFEARETKAHGSVGPHTRAGLPVRVFLDPVIDGSLAAKNSSHPAGSSIVKEMFDVSGDLQGWAVMVKTSADSARGDGWFWYEVIDTEDGSNPVASGNGVGLCTGCHFAGDDFVLTHYPLR